jgi:hypothetical protein
MGRALTSFIILAKLLDTHNDHSDYFHKVNVAQTVVKLQQTSFTWKLKLC